MTLPPDFWTKPDTFGAYGMGIGFVAGFFLSFYLFPRAGIYSLRAIIGLVINLACMLIGGIAVQILHLYWIGYF
jgi:hypothetical protein